MARSGSFIGLFVSILMFFSNGHLYAQKLFSEVSLDKTSVYVGEPVQVTISVFTSTWFTRGIDLGNIKVNGAFTVFFRPVSTSIVRDGQKYAGVELLYNVFPFSEKDLEFPSLDIVVETPPDGDFKGQRQVIKSAEKRIRVKPVPPGFEQDSWLVTTSLSLSSQWQGDPANVKVGDVLVRDISRVAQGTVSELIPPIQWDSVPGVSQYRARGTVENNQTRTSISATRTETMRFLFEKEGEVTLPALVFSWYDPVQKELFKRTLKEITIHVQPNPDLGVLESIRDSLLVAQAETMQESQEKEPFTILGRSPGQFALVLLPAALLAYVLQLIIKRMLRQLTARQKQFRNSEAYYFQKFKKAAGGKDKQSTIKALYQWIDRLELQEPSIAYFAGKYGSKALQEEAHLMVEQMYAHQSGMNLRVGAWQEARKKYLASKSDQGTGRISSWINPVEYKGHTKTRQV